MCFYIVIPHLSAGFAQFCTSYTQALFAAAICLGYNRITTLVTGNYRCGTYIEQSKGACFIKCALLRYLYYQLPDT